MADQFQSLTRKSRPLGSPLYDDSSYWQDSRGWTFTIGRSSPKPFTGSLTSITNQGYQVTWSRGNPWPNKGRVGDFGGPFRSIKVWYSRTPYGDPVESWKDLALRLTSSASPTVWYDTYQKPIPFTNLEFAPNDVINAVSPNAEKRLSVLGTMAIERCKPTRTANQLFVSLTELKRDGVPSVVGIQARDMWRDFSKRNPGLRDDPKRFVLAFHKFLQGSGSEFLNLVFGWAPLAGDTQRLLESYSKLPQIWAQYERDAGRRVRRRYQFPTERSTTVTKSTTAPGDPIVSSYCYGGPFSRSLSETIERDVWFDGAFRYYLPDRKSNSALDELYRFAAYANKVYGISPTPDALWNVIPWTWAADWVTNLGSVVSNLSDSLVNGLVLEYGYVCERIRRCRAYEADFGWRETLNGPTRPVHLQLFQNVQILNRVQATPYGFGVTWDGFSPSQLAILASLGITRGRQP